MGKVTECTETECTAECTEASHLGMNVALQAMRADRLAYGSAAGLSTEEIEKKLCTTVADELDEIAAALELCKRYRRRGYGDRLASIAAEIRSEVSNG